MPSISARRRNKTLGRTPSITDNSSARESFEYFAVNCPLLDFLACLRASGSRSVRIKSAQGYCGAGFDRYALELVTEGGNVTSLIFITITERLVDRIEDNENEM